MGHAYKMNLQESTRSPHFGTFSGARDIILRKIEIVPLRGIFGRSGAFWGEGGEGKMKGKGKGKRREEKGRKSA